MTGFVRSAEEVAAVRDHQATNALWSSKLVSPEGTDFDYPIQEISVKHEADTNLRPCEETGCSP